MALLLEGVFRERLTKMGLHCDKCEANPQLKRERGCGVPPVNPHTGRAWDVVEFLSRAHEKGLRGAAVWEAAEREYPLADAGDIYDSGGGLWPCCPKFYARTDLVNPVAVRHALRAHQMVNAIRREDPTRARTRPLTAHGLALVNLTERLWTDLANDKQAEDAEAKRRDREWRANLRGGGGNGRPLRRGGR